MDIKEKIESLKTILLKYKKILLAYSGGVDSTLLLKAAVDTLGNENVIAATAISPTYTEKELETAKKITKEFIVKHMIIKTYEFNNKNFIMNSKDRCYFCKKELFEKLGEIKDEYKCDIIMDGSNYDDLKDFRPGTKAEKEYHILTPLKDAFFTKKEIREYSKNLGLITYNHPAIACLASRIPYDEEITNENIKMIREGEEFLSEYGFNNFRLRTSNKTARIEVDKKDIKKIIKNKEKIIKKLKSLGYYYITVDLEGFRSGSMNEVL